MQKKPEDEEDDLWLTPGQAMALCMIVGIFVWSFAIFGFLVWWQSPGYVGVRFPIPVMNSTPNTE